MFSKNNVFLIFSVTGFEVNKHNYDLPLEFCPGHQDVLELVLTVFGIHIQWLDRLELWRK